MKKYPIVLSTDDNYVLQLCVALNSLRRNRPKKEEVNIYIFYSALSEGNKKLIQGLQTKNFTIELVNIAHFFKSANLYSVEGISIAMYYRFAIPKILSQYKKVLYLDCDIVCTKNIYRIFNENIENQYIGAVEDIYLPNSGYMNSGVLLFNIDLWNKNSLIEKCIDYINKNSNLKCPDQDAINEVCKNKIKILSFQYNFQQFCCYYIDKLYNIKFPLKDVGAFHFLSQHKPWKYPNYPLADKWWKEVKYLPKKHQEQINRKFLPSINLEKPLSEYYKYYFATPFQKFWLRVKKKTSKK